MTTLMRWEPFREFTTLQDRLNRLFREGALGSGHCGEGERAFSDWAPECDISEDAEKIEVRAALPGMDMKDITVQVENNTLAISGERKTEKKEKTHRTEWFYGTFYRRFTLPPTVRGDQAKATYDRGVLTVTLPKREETKPKKIDIEVH